MSDGTSTGQSLTKDFGTVYVNQTTWPTYEFTLTNTGTQAFTPQVGTPTNSAFTVTGESGSLASGASRTYTVTFHPTATGNYSGNFHIRTTAVEDALDFVVNLSGSCSTDASSGISVEETELYFGTVNSGSTGTRTFTVNNSGATATGTISVDAPYSVANSTVTLNNPSTTVTVTFTPQDAQAHTQYLTLSVGSKTFTVRLSGYGQKEGELATRDSVFFSKIDYTWTDQGGTEHTSNLTEIATDPDQMIAMMEKVYIDQTIPGNIHRGYTSSYEPTGNVYYGAIGKMVQNYSSGSYSYSYSPESWGWRIPPKQGSQIQSATIGSYNYRYFDPTDYKPVEGVTVLLVEVKDDQFVHTPNVTNPTSYDALRTFFSTYIKSVRVVTNSSIAGSDTGNDRDMATIFSINAQKLNRYFMLAKGRLREFDLASYRTEGYSLGVDPCMSWRTSESESRASFKDTNSDDYANPFRMMFEQFSPTNQAGTVANDNLLDLMKTGSTFPVIHDCASVLTVTTGNSEGHAFNLYGASTTSDDGKIVDVHGLLFTVPKYRMRFFYNSATDSRDGTNTETGSNHYSWDMYQNYYNVDTTDLRPRMGMFALWQWPIVGERVNDNYVYKLDLSWYSNLLTLLPEGGYYRICQVVDGNYVPVYETSVVNGEVVTSSNLVQVTATKKMSATPSENDTNNETFSPLYVPMQEHGYTVTYVIQAYANGGWLPVQTSNERSFVIPGWNRAEMLNLKLGEDYTSRFEPQGEYNYYSNGLQVTNHNDGVKASYLSTSATQPQFIFYRMSDNMGVDAQGNEVVVSRDTVTIATGTVLANNQIRIDMVANTQVSESEFPEGKTTKNKAAGYHSQASSFTITYTTDNQGYVNFGDSFKFYDNFRASTASNAHPDNYTYWLNFGSAVDYIDGGGASYYDETTGHYVAHSNQVSVNVPHTNMDMHGTLTLGEVIRDGKYSPRSTLSDGINFDVNLKYFPMTDVFRYNIYRWPMSDTRYVVDVITDSNNETVVAPQGSADNNASSYSYGMNGVNQGSVSIAPGQTKPAYFNDNINEGGNYIYGPVIERYPMSITNYHYHNTYGAPLKTIVKGTLAVEVDPQLNTVGHEFMSEYKWYQNGAAYSYYNIPLRFTAIDVPEGYELYKVRAWRQVENADNVLGEQLSTRSPRLSDDYLFEDIDYGMDLTAVDMTQTNVETNYGKMSRTALLNDAPSNYPLGNRAITAGTWFEEQTTPDGDDNPQEGIIKNETHATFGAKRLAIAGDNSGTLEELNATFIVRAYFTKVANPAVGGEAGYPPLYVIGTEEGNTNWDTNTPLATLYTTDGQTYYGSVPMRNAGQGYGYVKLTTQLGNSIWDNSYGTYDNDWEIQSGVSYNNMKKGTDSKAFKGTPGNYQVKVTATVNGTGENMTVTPHDITFTHGGTINAPRRAEAVNTLTPADYNYYVAEGSVEFKSSDYDNIITGIDTPVVDRSHEVVGVTYVNMMGQTSDRPFQGVNIIVTRYSDGTQTTEKVIR